MTREPSNYDDRLEGTAPIEKHEQTNARPVENYHAAETEAKQITSDTRAQIDATIPGILKKD